VDKRSARCPSSGPSSYASVFAVTPTSARRGAKTISAAKEPKIAFRFGINGTYASLGLSERDYPAHEGSFAAAQLAGAEARLDIAGRPVGAGLSPVWSRDSANVVS